MEKKYEYIAGELIRGSIQNKAQFDALLNRVGLEFRKNKTLTDIHKACEKAMRPSISCCCSELEIANCALYLSTILKNRKEKKEGVSV